MRGRRSVPLAPALFFFNDTATTEIYTLSLHDALPISIALQARALGDAPAGAMDAPAQRQALAQIGRDALHAGHVLDRKSTRLNSSHSQISYAVFCLKKKTKWTCSARSAAAQAAPPVKR